MKNKSLMKMYVLTSYSIKIYIQDSIENEEEEQEEDNGDEIAHLTMKSAANTESVERTVDQEHNINERYPTSAIANVY